MVTYIYQYYGVSIYFGESIEKISDNVKEVQPTVMTGVPRLIEKVYEKIIAKGSELTGIKKKLFFWAVELGLKYEPDNANGWWYGMQLKLARKRKCRTTTTFSKNICSSRNTCYGRLRII
jgi:long-chain acyl-CoA synthetase